MNTEAKNIPRHDNAAWCVFVCSAAYCSNFLRKLDFDYIYNQARCFEQNHRYDDAISRFREYLKKAPNLSEADRADAENHIADCQGFLTATR
jgi:hypothetical protein